MTDEESGPIRVLVVDDQALVRNGFAAILSTEDGIAIVGEAGNGAEALASVVQLRPDVVLMDIRMPVLDGVEATRRLCEIDDDQQPRVLMLTTFDNDELVDAALRAGAAGFLLKDASPEDLVDAIRTVHQGDALLAPSVLRRLIGRITDDRSEVDLHDGQIKSARALESQAALERLTERELDVLVLMAKGHSNREIAAATHLAETTVKTHVGRIFAKLGSRDRVQAVIVAYEAGLMS